MTGAIIGFGSDFLRGSVSVGEVLSMDAPSLSRETKDATHMKSPNRYREFIGALRDGGEVTFEIQADPESSQYQALIADFNNDDPEAYSQVFPGGANWSFSGLVTGIDQPVPMDDKITQNVTIKITGEPVFALGA